ncbi:MAG: ATP-binding protein [Deltaproteobacteria bacterium]|nr:ATP-binding protein [Deltaproteobacteria bacterium]MBI3294976.1 ATP-binding protein [Deltaproteobacteria bacterium]
MNAHVNCQCIGLSHHCKLVVVTGGPGAGKTAVLEIAKRNFCDHIVIIPESASIVFGGGFWRKESLPGKKAAQRAIFHVQRELERMVIEEEIAAIALCDRGTLDGLAYWPEGPEVFFKEVGIQRDQELERYAAVIHLRTPNHDQGYNLSNPVRVETAEEAHQIDVRTEQAWDGHPNHYFIDSGPEFLLKAQRAMDIIRQTLPSCCQTHRIKEWSERP